MALDVRNACNSVEHMFLYEVLKRCNSGDSFISWAKLLHANMELNVINNGFTGIWFPAPRGLKQGAPASGLFFALVIEILAINPCLTEGGGANNAHLRTFLDRSKTVADIDTKLSVPSPALI